MPGASADDQGIAGIAYASTDHRVDVHVELGIFRQPLQALIQHLEALFRDLVGHDIINRDLQVLQAGSVQPQDPLLVEQIAVGDHAGDHAVAADAANDVVNLRMQQRFAATDNDDGCAQPGQVINAPEHFLPRHWRRKIVVFVAISAGQIATAHGNDLRLHGMIRGRQALDDHFEFTPAPGKCFAVTPCPTGLGECGPACHAEPGGGFLLAYQLLFVKKGRRQRRPCGFQAQAGTRHPASTGRTNLRKLLRLLPLSFPQPG